jgi:hypothetical protein
MPGAAFIEGCRDTTVPCELGERTEASAERAEETLLAEGGDVATLDERLEPGGVAREVGMVFIDAKLVESCVQRRSLGNYWYMNFDLQVSCN